MQSFESTWFIPLLMGLTLLIAIFYYRRQARRLSCTLSQLYQLNVRLQQDTLDFLQQVWPVLQQAGFQRLEVQGSWFGESYEQVQGDQKLSRRRQRSFVFKVEQQDIFFEVVLYYVDQGAEARFKLSVVKETVKHILQANMLLKQMQVLAAQMQLQRYQLYVQHDLKNLAQSIRLLHQQLQSLEDRHAQVYLRHLKGLLPKLDQQAQSLLQPIEVSKDLTAQEIELVELIDSEAKALGLSYQLKAKPPIVVQLPLSALQQVFQNILHNFQQHAVGTELQIEIQSMQEQVSIQFFILKSPAPNQVEMPNPLRMFEPFWTSHQSGMGLGLFLVREMLKQMKGGVNFWQQEDRYGFEVVLPLPKL